MVEKRFEKVGNGAGDVVEDVGSGVGDENVGNVKRRQVRRHATGSATQFRRGRVALGGKHSTPGIGRHTFAPSSCSKRVLGRDKTLEPRGNSKVRGKGFLQDL